MPTVPKDGMIPDDPDSMPYEIEYHETKRRLLIGKGFIDSVPAARRHSTRQIDKWFQLFSSYFPISARPTVGTAA